MRQTSSGLQFDLTGENGESIYLGEIQKSHGKEVRKMEPGKQGEKIKDMEKLTTTKLREIALERYPQIKGVHGMHKEELIEAIKAVEVELGIREKGEIKKGPHHEIKHKGKREKKVWAIPEAKVAVRGLRKEREGALAARDPKQLKAVKTRIRRLKRIMRKLKEAS